jgi:hypothetical protein
MIYKTPYFTLNTDTLSLKDGSGNEVVLQNMEFGLLKFLCEQNKALNSDEILEAVWDRNADYSSNVVAVSVAKIRKKIDKDCIKTKMDRYLVDDVTVLGAKLTAIKDEPIKKQNIRKATVILAITVVIFSGSIWSAWQFLHPSSPISVSEIHATPKNKITTSIDEWILITNTTNSAVDLKGWKVSDAAGHTFVFRKQILQPEKSIKLITGICEDTTDQICWNFRSSIWNNDKDTVYLTDPNGELRYQESYDYTKVHPKIIQN